MSKSESFPETARFELNTTFPRIDGGCREARVVVVVAVEDDDELLGGMVVDEAAGAFRAVVGGAATAVGGDVSGVDVGVAVGSSPLPPSGWMEPPIPGSAVTWTSILRLVEPVVITAPVRTPKARSPAA